MNQDIYNIFGHKLKEASQPYPAHLWDTIQPQVPVYGKQGGRKVGWYWFAGLAILLVAAAIWFATETSHQNNQLKASLAPVHTNNVSTNHSNPAPIKKIVPLSYNQNDKKETSTNDQIRSETVSNRTDSPKAKNLRTIERTSSIRTNPNKSLINKADQVKKLPPTRTIRETQESHSSEGETSTMAGTESHRAIRSNLIVPMLPTRTNPLQKTSEVNFEMTPDPSCYNFSNRHQTNLTVDVYTGIGYGLRPMTSRNEDVSPYIDARKSTESFRYLFTAGARINLMMNNGLAFRTGAHYTQIGEKFDYTDSSAIRVIWISDTTFVGGDTIVNPPMQEIQPGTAIKKINNRYHSVDIPILIGYDVPLGRMQASVSGGPVINISAWQRGQFLNPSLEPAYINTEEPVLYYPAYKTTLGIGAYISASLAVPITENIWLFGEPHVLHRFNPVTFDDYPIKQSNTNFGINVGLKLKL